MSRDTDIAQQTLALMDQHKAIEQARHEGYRVGVKAATDNQAARTKGIELALTMGFPLSDWDIITGFAEDVATYILHGRNGPPA